MIIRAPPSFISAFLHAPTGLTDEHMDLLNAIGFVWQLKVRRVIMDKSNLQGSTVESTREVPALLMLVTDTTQLLIDPSERPAGPTTASYGQKYIVPKMKSTASRRQT